MGTDSTQSLSKEEQALIRILCERETGRPTVKEIDLRKRYAQLKQLKAIDDLGLMDTLLNAIQGDGEPPKGDRERSRADLSGLFKFLTEIAQKDLPLNKETLITGLGTAGSSMAGLVAPVLPPVALLAGWWMAEKYATYTHVVKDEEGNPKLDEKGNEITKTERLPPILHSSVRLLMLLIDLLSVLVAWIVELAEGLSADDIYEGAKRQTGYTDEEMEEIANDPIKTVALGMTNPFVSIALVIGTLRRLIKLRNIQG